MDKFTAYLRGHKIEWLNDHWIYVDTKEPTATTHKDRSCGHCGLSETKEGHDGCLGTLEGVMNACCGHGQVNEAYIQYSNSHTIRGKEAFNILETLK